IVLSPLSLSASMMRLNPSVCSRSVSAAFTSTAAVFSIGVTSLVASYRFLRTSSSSSWLIARAGGLVSLKQFLPVGFDIGGKAERMIARALFRQIGVALLERLDDGEMLGQRRRDAVGAS